MGCLNAPENSSRSSPRKMPPEFAAIFTLCAATSDRAAEVQHKMSEQYKRPVFPDYPFLVTMVALISTGKTISYYQ